MSDEIVDDPFGEEEASDEVELISLRMVKKATFLIHKLADQRREDYKEIQKKCKKLFAYTNLAKVTREDGHAMINKLLDLTGGEEEEKPEDVPTDDLTKEPKEMQEETTYELPEEPVIATMRKAVRAAVDITLKEVVDKDVPVQGLGGFVLEIGKVIFEAKMGEEASK